jgi:hypothetical protein
MTETSVLAPMAKRVSIIPSVVIGASDIAFIYGMPKSITSFQGHLKLDYKSNNNLVPISVTKTARQTQLQPHSGTSHLSGCRTVGRK